MRAARVYAIHMLGILVISIIFGITVNIEACWIFGGVAAFFMTGFHLPHIVTEVKKELND